MKRLEKTAARSASTGLKIMKNAGANIYVSRVVAAAVSLIAPLVVVAQNQAQAAGTCDTAAPVNNAAVDCSGGTIFNTNGQNGWGTGTETGDTITAESDAAVQGSNAGIAVQDATILNHGTIAGVNFGVLFNSTSIEGSVTNFANEISGNINAISAAGDVRVSNGGGRIFTNGVGGIGIAAGGTATISNAQGQITGDFAAIKANAINIKSNDGIIEAFGHPDVSNSVAAVWATGGDVFVHNGHGNIHALSTGAVAIQADVGAVTIETNDGDISGGKAAISAKTSVTVTSNNLNITAIDPGSSAISVVGGNATVTNGDGKGANGTISGDAFGIQAATLNIVNALGSTISSASGVGIEGSGTIVNAGLISGSTASVQFTGNGTNVLTLKTGSTLTGTAFGSTASADNQLILQGIGTANNDFIGFNSLTVQGSGVWILNGSSDVGTAMVTTGGLIIGDPTHPGAVLRGDLTADNVLLGGQGAVDGNVTLQNGALLRPGHFAPFSTFHVGVVATISRDITFLSGSGLDVAVNAAGQSDKVVATGSANLSGTVVVRAQNGTYAPSTQYTILTAAGGLNGTKFGGGVFTNFAFLTPSLIYGATDVTLQLDCKNAVACEVTQGGGGTGGGTTPNGFGFAAVAQTHNQIAVATSLDAGSATNPLIKDILGQSTDGARQAFDSLSGEVFGTVQNTQATHMHFTREAILGRMRQASYSSEAPNGLGALSFGGPELAYASSDAMAGVPGKAPSRPVGPSRDLTFWAQGLGGWGHADSDGNAASVRSRFGGFLSGADVRLGETWRAGLVAGYMRTDLNVDDRSSSAGIDSVQFGGYAGGKVGAFNVRGGASYSYDKIDTSRGIVFPGFTDQASAHFHGNVGQVFGEVGYGMALGQVALEPLAGLAYVNVRDDSFAESGGLAALSATSTSQSTSYSTLGLRAATAVPLANGTVLIPRGSVQWQYAFGDVTPVTALAFQSTGTSFTVAGIPIARNSALIEGGFDWRFSPQAKLGAYYQGELAAHAESHALKGALTWDF
jgi:fibronectin-binding autotransporter adhesin